MTLLMALLMIGATELLLISGVALLLFGGKKLPELMRGLGKGVKEFKEGMHDITNPGDQPNEDKTQTAEPKTQTDGGRGE